MNDPLLLVFYHVFSFSFFFSSPSLWRASNVMLGTYLTISEKAIVAPTVPAPTMATLAVLGFGIFLAGSSLVWFGGLYRGVEN